MGTLITTLDTSFVSLSWQLEQLQHYLEAIVSVVPSAPAAIPVAVEGAILVTVAGHEEFLASLAAGGIRRRKSVMRKYFEESGTEAERKTAASCDLGALIAMGSRRINFKKSGQSIDRLYEVMFGFSPWPSERVREQLVDLNLLRQIVAHHDGATIGDRYSKQLLNQSLLDPKRYGPFEIRRISHRNALIFLKDAVRAIVDQAHYIRQELERGPEWRPSTSSDLGDELASRI